MSKPRIAIVGATGAVGQEFLRVIKERAFPFSELTLLASAKSAGKTLEYNGQTYIIKELTEKSFKDIDIAFFSAGGGISKKFAPIARDAGTIVVDNSSAFRMTTDVPLIIPEVNPQHMDHISLGDSQGAIIANPNCSTILMLVALHPLHKANPIKRVVVSTYQAASGAGQAAMEELKLQTKEVLNGEAPTCEIFPFQYAFNMFSHNSPMMSNGYNEEELKMVYETAKIWGQDIDAPTTTVTATCIRVPVMRAHAESINLEFSEPFCEEEARAILASAPGISLQDDREGNIFPTPLQASHQDDVFVGRIRHDNSLAHNKGLNLFICGDQVKKGAALNAVQIAELLFD